MLHFKKAFNPLTQIVRKCLIEAQNILQLWKHGQILYQNLHTRPNLVKNISVPNSIFRNSTKTYHIWYRISQFRGGGLRAWWFGMTHSDIRTEVKNPHAAFSHGYSNIPHIYRSSVIWRLKGTKLWKSTLLRLKILLVLSHFICLVPYISILKHCKDIWNTINLRTSYKKHWPLFPLSLVL